MRMDLIKGTPCEEAIEKALQLAHQILAGEAAPFDGGRQIAWLGSADCYDFLNEVDVVDEMGSFWQIVDDAEQRQAAGLPPTPSRDELSEEIRRGARNLIEQFGPTTGSSSAQS
jgi:hypothetical protein